ncbi:MAG: chemotaxis protein CheW [Calditrichota bacterium]
MGSNQENLSFVSFALGEDDYAINVGEVYGIYHGLPVIPNPDGPAFLEGDVQFRDVRVPIVNLRRFAGMSDSRQTGRWILMVNNSGGPVGLVVDRVMEVVKLKPDSLQPAPDGINGPVSDYITAIADHHGRSMFVPDFNRLIHDVIS